MLRWRSKTKNNPLWYEIPYRALVPAGSKNFLCAGRMLDWERGVYRALRVMVNCNQMCESVGRAAVKTVKEGLVAAAFPGPPCV